MAGGTFASAVAMALSLAACSVGVGEGAVTGSVSIPGCGIDDGDYSLGPTFYGADAFEDQLTIRIQNGGDYPLESDGLSIVVLDATAERERLGTPITLTAADDAPVSMAFYLNDSCPSDRDDVPVFLQAVEGTITFDNIYAPEVDDDRSIAGHFEGVRFVGAESDTDDGQREALLDGEFRFLFERGRPAQPFP